MFSNEESKIIARLIVAGVSIDGSLNSKERESLAECILNQTYINSSLNTLVADVGYALDNDFGDFDIFQDSKNLLDKLGSRAVEISPKIFKLVSACVSGDRFISAQEASFLSALSRRLKISTPIAGKILKELIESKRGKIEVGGEQIDALIHPHLKELLSFSGSNELVGEIKEDSLEERIFQASQELSEIKKYSHEEIQNSLSALGLNSTSSIEDAKEIWQKSLASINLLKLSEQGETFVTAALNQAKIINDAYTLLVSVEKSIRLAESKKNDIEVLEGKLGREIDYAARESNLADKL